MCYSINVIKKMQDKKIFKNNALKSLGGFIALGLMMKPIDNFVENVRDLEGALRRFVTYCVSLNLPFTAENVYFTLKEILPKAKVKSNTQDDEVNKLKQIVCSYFQISEEDLNSSSRKPNIVYARTLCFYIIRNKIGLNFKKIGELFGGKDHTTIMYGHDKIKDSIEQDSNVKKDVQYIEEKLNS